MLASNTIRRGFHSRSKNGVPGGGHIGGHIGVGAWGAGLGRVRQPPCRLLGGECMCQELDLNSFPIRRKRGSYISKGHFGVGLGLGLGVSKCMGLHAIRGVH